jgi:hypothetical protein
MRDQRFFLLLLGDRVTGRKRKKIILPINRWLYKKKEEHISQQKTKSNNKKHKKTHTFSHPLPHTPKDTLKKL